MNEDNYKEIENSVEIKATIDESKEINRESTLQYKNKVANKILDVSTAVLIIGIAIGVFGGLFLFATTEEFLGILLGIILAIASFVFSILLNGLAEIIELLQSIKDK